jgi:RNA polymerase sigma factor (sigma-70 family)
VAGSSEEPTDDQLMQRLKEGKTDALGVLYERHRAVVHAVLVHQGGRLSPADAEDTCHEVFLSLIDLAPRYRPGQTLRGWLCGIALKKARRLRDRGRSRLGLLARFFSGRSEAAGRTAPAEALLEAEALLGRLPQPLQEVALLTFVQDLTAQEVGEALGLSAKTVSNRLYKARLLVRDLLAGGA